MRSVKLKDAIATRHTDIPRLNVHGRTGGEVNCAGSVGSRGSAGRGPAPPLSPTELFGELRPAASSGAAAPAGRVLRAAAPRLLVLVARRRSRSCSSRSNITSFRHGRSGGGRAALPDTSTPPRPERRTARIASTRARTQRDRGTEAPGRPDTHLADRRSALLPVQLHRLIARARCAAGSGGGGRGGRAGVEQLLLRLRKLGLGQRAGLLQLGQPLQPLDQVVRHRDQAAPFAVVEPVA